MTMRRFRRSLLLASMLASAPVLLTATTPAAAQVSVAIGFDTFHDQLANDGDWVYSDRWGEVWRPDAQDRDSDWRPYWAGHWVFTDAYGWTWISDEGAWGDIAYHYGRWVNDPDDGWLWIAGYVWSPAWVVWRSAGPDVGWMPMPPDDDFLRPSGVSVSFGDWSDIGGYYGYSRWYGPQFDEARFGALWTFVPGERLTDRSFRRYALPRPQTVTLVRGSRNITNYTVVNNIIINRSVNINVVAPRGGRPPQPVRASTVLGNNRFIAPVNQGVQIQQRARQERPRGNGLVNSAPPPTPIQIRGLSNRAIPVRAQNNAPNAAPGAPPNAGAGNGQRHLFNRNDAAQLANPARGGNPQQTPAPNAQAPQNPNPQNRNPQERGPQNRENREPQNLAPQTQPAVTPPPSAPTPPSEQPGRGNRPERNLDRQAQPERPATPPAPTPPPREQTRPTPPPASIAPPTPPREQARPTPPAAAPNPPPAEQRNPDRGNRPERNLDRAPQAQPERPVTPPAPPPREQARPAPPPAPPREPARPTPPADRGQPDRLNRDRSDPDNRNDNR
jgi:hypothetical protein